VLCLAFSGEVRDGEVVCCDAARVEVSLESHGEPSHLFKIASFRAIADAVHIRDGEVGCCDVAIVEVSLESHGEPNHLFRIASFRAIADAVHICVVAFSFT